MSVTKTVEWNVIKYHVIKWFIISKKGHHNQICDIKCYQSHSLHIYWRWNNQFYTQEECLKDIQVWNQKLREVKCKALWRHQKYAWHVSYVIDSYTAWAWRLWDCQWVWDMASITLLWLADLNIDWEMPQLQCIMSSCGQWKFPPFSQTHWQSLTQP